MNLKSAFSRFLEADPTRLHFAAHSHHPWPDVSFDAHQQAWLDAANHMDDKWDHIFGTVFDQTKQQIANAIGVEDADNVAFSPNTHTFVNRLFSCFDPPVRVLSTDAEFHSFARQSRRWEEEGLAIVDRIPAEPFATFADRFTAEARSGAHDLIFFSEVFFDSGFVVPQPDRIVSSVSEEKAFVVIDGYHGFLARPVDFGSIQDRAFYIAGGYKYAMAGEGVCFMYCPPGYGERPVDTGWYAGFGQLETGVSDLVPYGRDGSRFAGATFDPSGVYRLNAVLTWLESVDVDARTISRHVKSLQSRFLDADLPVGELIPSEEFERGNFITYRTPDAKGIYERLHASNVITDYRRDRVRFGFGVYHDEDDVDALVKAVGSVLEA